MKESEYIDDFKNSHLLQYGAVLKDGMTDDRAAQIANYEHGFFVNCFERVAKVANIYDCSYEPFKGQLPYPNTKNVIKDSELKTINGQLDTLSYALRHLDQRLCTQEDIITGI